MATPTTIHSEKITHAVNALNNAGLGDGSPSSPSSLSSSSSSSSSNTLGLDNKKWIIIGASVGGVVLLALLILIFIFLRQRRRRRSGAYNSVGRGVDMQQQGQPPAGHNPALGAAPGPGMRGFLMPAWRAKGKGPELGPQGERALRDPSVDLGSRASSMDTSREVFDAEREERENDSMLVGGNKIAERNFESGYDSVDTGYETTNYRAQGDKRSAMSA